MYADHFAGGLDKTINALCSPSSPMAPMSLNLTGPCHIVAYFQLLLDAPTPLPSEFLTYLIGTGLPCILVTWIESYRYREKQHWLLSYPTFWLLMTQLATIGMTFPVFWLLLIISRRNGSRRGDPAQTLSSAVGYTEAQALAFGLVFGAVAPSIAMVVTNDHHATFVWQAYPVYVSSLRAFYARYAPTKTPSVVEGERKNSATREAHAQGRTTLRAVYIGTFLLSTFMHMRAVWPPLLQNGLEGITSFLIPSGAPASDADIHPSITALNFLKWDYAIGYFAFALGLLWSARSMRQITAMLIWYVVGVPVLGMGGATMAVLCWRDGI
ncbi:hypothetical protein GALMADRAFT_256637 [Galerina marginata CBS 339.88]|uniref:Uncharacterized protein n=1 Tax=Galerina marginata (strain CBS 339.88) TaxID=685588 RepID=A0A067SPS5_GALM3|nr:hypothetical protein GALMADRAFT_256637 [Galerina marginata CBS 339.88]